MLSRGIACIYKKELKAYFASPIAYVVIASFLFLAGNFFYGTIADFQQSLVRSYSMEHLNVNDMIIRPTLYNLSVLLLFIVPLITMSCYAEEKKCATMELLKSSPISTVDIVIGKYVAALSFFSIMLACTLIYPLVIMVLGVPDYGPILTGYFGVFLMGSLFISIGLLNSSFTENQVVAAILTFGMLLLLWIFGWIAEQISIELLQGLSTFSVLEHFSGIVQGVVDTRDIFYFVSGTAFFLFLTNRSLQQE